MKKKTNEVHITQQPEELLVEIFVSSGIVVRVLLFTLTLVFILLIVFNALFSNSYEVHIVRLIISFAILGLIAAFFGRLFLWNTFGVERIYVRKNTLRIIHDFRLFKNPPVEFSFAEMKVNFRNTDTNAHYTLNTIDAAEIASMTGNGFLEFICDTESYESDVKISAADGMRISNAITNI